MAVFAKTQAVTRYHVGGTLETPVVKTVKSGLQSYAIADIDQNPSLEIAGWTAFETPFAPDFDAAAFVYDPYFVFSLRIDRKTISPKLIEKEMALEKAKKLAGSDRRQLRPDEKKMLKEHVLNLLLLRVPATPNIFNLIWHYENAALWFFSTLKKPNETLVSLFQQSFQLQLIQRIPYLAIYNSRQLTDTQKETLLRLSPEQQGS